MRKTKKWQQIVTPGVFKKTVFQELHVNLGHIGSDKVLDLARQRFYWPNMSQDIEFFVRNQCRCLIAKKPNIPDRAPLVPVEATYPFEIISIHFFHLDRASGGYEYALVVCDHFTRFTQVYATKNKYATSAATKVYNEFILNFGFLAKIHHDRGGEFNNKLFKQLHKLAGIKNTMTTPYHPMGNGQPERFNRTIINMLKTLNEKEKGAWAKYIAKLAFAYNSTSNKATGFSPFFLMFGREARLPIDGIFGIEPEKTGKKTYDAFVRDWKKTMESAIQIAGKNTEKMRNANEKSYNQKVRGAEIKVGDKVLLRNCEKGGTGKMRAHFENTIYVVREKHPEVPVYGISPENNKRVKKRVHNIETTCSVASSCYRKWKTRRKPRTEIEEQRSSNKPRSPQEKRKAQMMTS